MSRYEDISFSDKSCRYSISQDDSLEFQNQNNHRLLPYIHQTQSKIKEQSLMPLEHPKDIESLVQSNILKNLFIKLLGRRKNWALQNIKLIGFDESTVMDSVLYERTKSKNQIINMTAQNLILTIDKVLLVKVQNRLSDAFLRIKFMKKKKGKKPVKSHIKVGLFLVVQVFNKKKSSLLSSIVRHQLSKKRSQLPNLETIQESISKYRSQIHRLENSSRIYSSKYSSTSNFQTPPKVYIPKQPYRTPRPSTSSLNTLVQDFQICLTDVSNYNFKKKKELKSSRFQY